jgi:hypothetical protein
MSKRFEKIDCDWIILFALFLLALLLGGCAAQKPKAAVPTQQPSEIVPGHPTLHYGPEHIECDLANNCETVRNWLTPDGKPVLSPLGCWLAKLRVTWIFGDKPSMCLKKDE